jgi:hypothetical protein
MGDSCYFSSMDTPTRSLWSHSEPRHERQESTWGNYIHYFVRAKNTLRQMAALEIACQAPGQSRKASRPYIFFGRPSSSCACGILLRTTCRDERRTARRALRVNSFLERVIPSAQQAAREVHHTHENPAEKHGRCRFRLPRDKVPTAKSWTSPPAVSLNMAW